MQKQERRAQHLMDLGLCGEKEIQWTSKQESQSQYYDTERKMFYSYKTKPIELTDEDYAELCKYYPESTDINRTPKSAKILRAVGITILVLGILMGLILFFTNMMIDSGKYTYSEDMVFNPMCFVYLLSAVIPSVVTWAFANAVADIVNPRNGCKG